MKYHNPLHWPWIEIGIALVVTLLVLWMAARGHGADGDPQAPTPQPIVEAMLKAAKPTKNDFVVDLGSGDGRVVITAAKVYGCHAAGVEIDKKKVDLSRKLIKDAGVEALAFIEHRDILKTDFSRATILTMYLYPDLMAKIVPRIKKMKPGTKVYSYMHMIPGIQEDKVLVRRNKAGGWHRVYVWTVKEK